VSTFWAPPPPWAQPAHAARTQVLHQVGSVAAARQAARAGVDFIVAQGVEAGGHVAGQVATIVLVPRVVDAVAPTPVVAAGGIADARGVVAALALGADGVVLGTRFLATPEAAAHSLYKEKVVAATEEDTVLTMLFGGGWPNAPHRALRTPFVEQWLGKEARGQEQRADEPVIGEAPLGGQRVPVPRFWAAPPTADASGDVGGEGLLERLRAAGGTAADGLLEDVDGPVGHAGRLVHLAEVAKPHLDHELVVAREDAESVEAEEPRAGDDRGRGGDARPAPVADPGDQLGRADRRKRQQGRDDLDPIAREDEERDHRGAVEDHEAAEQPYGASRPHGGDH